MAMPTSNRKALALAGAVIAGCVSATVFEVALNHAGTFLALLIATTTLPLFLTGLGTGPLAGLMASTTGFLSLIVRDPSNYAVLYVLLFALPTFAVIALALRQSRGTWLPEGSILAVLALYPCALFLTIFGLSTTHPGGLLALSHDFFVDLATNIDQAKPGSGAQVTASISFLSHYLPAAIGIVWILVTAVCLLLAQRVLQQHNWNLRPAVSLRAIRLPNFLVNIVALGAVAAVLANDPYAYVGANIAVMLGLGFFFVGVAVVHAWAGTKNFSPYILIAFYGLLAVGPVLSVTLTQASGLMRPAFYLALIVALLGVIDQWADFRKNLLKQTRPT